MRNSSRVIAIVALLIAVVSLGVGFAAFSATLTITSPTATVEKADQFSPYIRYSSTSPVCYYTGDSTKTSIITGSYNAGSTTSGTSWSGVSVPIVYDTVNEVFKSVTCEAEMENGSVYDAYLRGISTSSALDAESVATTGDNVASAESITMVKNNTTVTVDVNGDTAAITSSGTVNMTTGFTDANSYIQAISGANPGVRTVKLIINYTGSSSPDGDVRVLVPTVTLTYKTQ